MLADRVERYLRQHPYVSTLVISAVNAGRGEQLADMLVELQRRKQLQHVNYDIRIFAPDFDGADTASGRGARRPDARRVDHGAPTPRRSAHGRHPG